MNITKLENYRKLKELRARVTEFDKAIQAFEGELQELGELRAKHYASQYRAEELQQAIKGEHHE